MTRKPLLEQDTDLPRWLPTIEIRYTIPKDVSLSILTKTNGALMAPTPYSKPTKAKPYARRYYRNVEMTLTRDGEEVLVKLEPMTEELTGAEMNAAVHLVIAEFGMLDVGLL